MCQGTMYWMTASEYMISASVITCGILADNVTRPVNFLSRTFSAAVYALPAKLMTCVVYEHCHLHSGRESSCNLGWSHLVFH